MLKNANFLCEIGTEEIPAGYFPEAIASIDKNIRRRFDENRMDYGDVLVMATPRRFVFIVSDLSDMQRREEVELKGPVVSSAYNEDGSPAKPLIGFMNGNGLSEKELFKKTVGKGEYVFAKKVLPSKAAIEIIPEIIKNLLRDIHFPKRMRWSDKTLTFPRPIDYITVIFNNKAVSFDMEEIPLSDSVRGHYIQHDRMLPISDISEYGSILLSNGVIVNQGERKEEIKKQLKEAAAGAGLTLRGDEELLDTVTYIVENPNVVICEFDENFLNVPDIALVAEMKENQKYFPLYDADGKLSNKFLVVANNPVTPFIKAGNERVIAARFSDARFFYTEDRKKKLSDMVDSLKDVLFHKDLGSIYDKVLRMQKVSVIFADMIGLEQSLKDKLARATYLCKADLNTAMVFEFPSLQGKIGRIYALEDGEDPDVADAIEEHYKAGQNDVPNSSSIISLAASITEKLDNIFGSFSVGNIPKGSADPYALRRQANAIVEMLIKNRINISMKELLAKIAPIYKNGIGLVEPIIEFISARARTVFSDNGFSHDEIEACLSTGSSDFTELFRRAQSLNSFRKNEKFSQMLLSLKRMNNIVSGFKRDNPDYELVFDPSLLTEKEERDLFEAFDSQKANIGLLISQSRYIDLFELLTDDKPIIDAFFDKVLVMDERTAVRDSRLAMLNDILSGFSGLIDFSKISDK